MKANREAETESAKIRRLKKSIASMGIRSRSCLRTTRTPKTSDPISSAATIGM